MPVSQSYLDRRAAILALICAQRLERRNGESARVFICRVTRTLQGWGCGGGALCWCSPHVIHRDDDRPAAEIIADIEASETVH